MTFIYRVHAIERMFQRDISELEVENVVKDGLIIESYLDDKPYASYLSLGYINSKAIHVVYAKDNKGIVIIITVYEPSLIKWQNDFKTRRETK